MTTTPEPTPARIARLRDDIQGGWIAGYRRSRVIDELTWALDELERARAELEQWRTLGGPNRVACTDPDCDLCRPPPPPTEEDDHG